MAKLSIADIEQSPRGPVWVLNRTSGEGRSNILFTVPKTNGNGSDTVEVPATFIPINLAEQVSRRQLNESSDFRRAVSRGFLTLIDEEEANDLLSEDGVNEERERLRNLSDVTRSTHQMSALEGAKVQDPAVRDLNLEGATVESEGGIDGITAGVVGFFEALVDKEADEISTLNSLRGLGELPREDYKWIGRQCDKHGGYPRIRAWARRMLGLD